MKSLLFLVGFLPTLVLCQPQYEWAYGLGGPGGNILTDLITDEFGNVYVTGTFEGVLRYDTVFPATILHDTVTNLLPDDGFIVKLSPSGRLLWHKTFGSYGYDLGIGLALSSNGELYWAGGFTDLMNLDGFILRMNDTIPYLGGSPADNFIAKLDTSTGECLSLRQIGGLGRDNLQWIGIDSEDGLWIGGTTASSQFDLGGIVLDSVGFYLVKYSSDDSVLFVVEGELSENFSFFLNTKIQSADISDLGEVHLSFRTVSGLSIDGESLCMEGCHLWLKISPDGNLLNWRDITDFPGQVAAGPNGSVFLAGFYDRQIQIDSLILSGGDKRNMYSLRFDSTGKLIWIDHWETSSLPGGSIPQISEVSFWGGKLYWIGNWSSPLYPSNGDTLISAGLIDGLMMRYDQDGGLDWAKKVGGNSDNFLNHLTVGSSGEIYSTGSFYSLITLADTIIIPNVFGALDQFETWVGKMQEDFSLSNNAVNTSSVELVIYPNPFQNEINIEGLPKGVFEICLLNINGELIYKGYKDGRIDEGNHVIEIPYKLPSGSYFLLLKGNSGMLFSIPLTHH